MAYGYQDFEARQRRIGGECMTDKERIDLITSIAEDIAEINGKETQA